MRIIHKANDPIETDHKGFSSISRMLSLANRHSAVKMVLNLKKILKANGNLASLYAALSYSLERSSNRLAIWPQTGCSLTVNHHKDLFGSCGRWDSDLESVFQSGASRVVAFDRHEYDRFNDYLLLEAFRVDWKGVLPYHYKLDVKDLLRKLYRNASEHSNGEGPIFISSSYCHDMLRFTLVDCGHGFKKNISSVNEESCSEGDAIRWAFNGNSVKGEGKSATLKCVGQYCTDNGGELLVVSGATSVRFCNKGLHRERLLPAPFRGSIVNLSVKINRMVFEEKLAA